MKLTRKQFRKLILEATIDYIDNEGQRKAEKASGILSNNNLRMQLQSYYNDAYEEKLRHQQNITGGGYPELAQELAHEGSVHQAKDDFQNYLEDAIIAKYGASATMKFGAQDFIDEPPNDDINLRDIISFLDSDKVKYSPSFKDFPQVDLKDLEVEYDPVGELEMQDFTVEDEDLYLQRQAELEAKRRELGSELKHMLDTTVPRAEYSDEETDPAFLSLDDIMTDTTSPKGGR